MGGGGEIERGLLRIVCLDICTPGLVVGFCGLVRVITSDYSKVRGGWTLIRSNRRS